MLTALQAREILATVTDPEIPVITIEDLGILRDVSIDGDRVVVTITPTYSGCPAMAEITADISLALAPHEVEVRTTLSPAWTTDWMSQEGKDKLRAYGIAPPTRLVAGPVPVTLGRRGGGRLTVGCPLCGSDDTEQLSAFGSTSCKSLWRCRACGEPFDHFKAH